MVATAYKVIITTIHDPFPVLSHHSSIVCLIYKMLPEVANKRVADLTGWHMHSRHYRL